MSHLPGHKFTLVDPFTSIRRLFYIVTPNETSYPELHQVPRYIDESIPYFILLVAIEYLIIGYKTYRIGDAICSLSAGLLMTLLRTVVISFEVTGYAYIWEHFHIMDLKWDSPLVWLGMFLFVDFAYYWFHRMSHEVNIIWASHQAHHSSEQYNLSTALRQPVVQTWFSFLFYLPGALFVRPSIFFTHLVGNLGFLEWMLNTPAHHRVHHARNREAIDRNYGGTLIVWDRMFGTFEPERPTSRWSYGLTHPITTFDPLEVQFFHFKYIAQSFWKQKGLWNKLSIIFKGPGWAPGKPRLGLITDIPDVSGQRRADFDPRLSGGETLYGLVHFLVAVYVAGALQLNVLVWSPSQLFLGSMFVLWTFTSTAWMFEKRASSLRWEMVRLAVVVIASPLLVVFDKGLVPRAVLALWLACGFHLMSLVGLSLYQRCLAITGPSQEPNVDIREKTQ